MAFKKRKMYWIMSCCVMTLTLKDDNDNDIIANDEETIDE